MSTRPGHLKRRCILRITIHGEMLALTTLGISAAKVPPMRSSPCSAGPLMLPCASDTAMQQALRNHIRAWHGCRKRLLTAGRP